MTINFRASSQPSHVLSVCFNNSLSHLSRRVVTISNLLSLQTSALPAPTPQPQLMASIFKIFFYKKYETVHEFVCHLCTGYACMLLKQTHGFTFISLRKQKEWKVTSNLWIYLIHHLGRDRQLAMWISELVSGMKTTIGKFSKSIYR